LCGPSWPVKAECSGRDGRRRGRQREVAEDEHPVVPQQLSHLHGVKRDLTQQCRNVPLPGHGSPPHQQQGRYWVATFGHHPARVTGVAWPRLGGDLARTGRPAQVTAPLDIKPLDRRPHLLEASVPGVFAAGNVRHGSIKRVASAWERARWRAMFVHRYLSEP